MARSFPLDEEAETMRARLFGVTATIVALIGCGDDESRTLTADDITPIPPGTAVGSLYSGNYIVTSGGVEACHCRAGSCSLLRVGPGALSVVTENDGVLQMTIAGAPCDGGVDTDGSFRCDGEQIGSTSSMGFTIASGQFHAPSGQPTSMSMTQEVTFTAAGFDCDVKASALSQYSGPPSALVTTTTTALPVAAAHAGAPAGLLSIAIGQ